MRGLQVALPLKVPGSLGHLVSRFFDYLAARPLGVTETQRIRSWLTEGEQALFFGQSDKDQSHGYHAGAYVESSDRGTAVLIRAALMHDVGKRHAGLGVVGRSVASILIKLRVPLSGRMRAYRDHGELGARDLEMAGSPRLMVDFARSHHWTRPATIDAGDWDLLERADNR